MQREVDVVAEATNVGGGHAATALSTLLAHEVTMSLPRVVEGDADKVARLLPPGEQALAELGVVGQLSGALACLYPEPERYSEVLGCEGEMLESAFAEIANIIGARFVIAITELTGLDGEVTPPTIHRTGTAGLPAVIRHLAPTPEPFLAVTTRLRVEGLYHDAELVFFPDEQTRERLADVI